MIWRQEDIVLGILASKPKTLLSVDDVIAEMKNLGYAPRKYKRDTITTVLSRLYHKGKITRSSTGRYCL